MIFGFSSSAFAFVENYSLFGANEQSTINGPESIDGEYYSDLLAFRHNLITDYNFLSANNAYDIYVGSVSSKQFAIQQRLKLNQQISEKLFFDLVYIDKENLEEAREQFLTGLTYKLSKAFSLSAYGSLFSDKSQNDVGFAVNVNLQSNHQLRLFMNLIDFDFTERNQVDAVDQKSPRHFGLMGRILQDQFQFVEYYLYKNSSVVRDFTQIDQRYVFEETRAGLRGRQKITSNYYLNFDVDVFTGKEGQSSLSAFDPATDFNWQRDGLKALIQVEKENLLMGLEYNYRYWSAQQGAVQHSNIMPHVWYQFRLKDTIFLPQRIDTGLEASFHEASGPMNLRSSTDANSDINSRFNLRLHYEFSKTAFLNLLLSADLDDKFSWEGGAGQFQMLF